MHDFLTHGAGRFSAAARNGAVCTLVALALAAAAPASAALFVADFNTLATGTLNGQEGGIGPDPWVSTGPQVIGSNLTSANYLVTQTGLTRSVQSTSPTVGPNGIAHRQIVNPLTGVVWFSFLAQLTDNADRVGLSINPLTTSPVDQDGDFIFVGGASSGEFRARPDNLAIPAAVTSGLSQNGTTTYLVLGRIGINESGVNDTLSVWLNPNVTSITSPSSLLTATYTNNSLDWITNSQISRIGAVSYDGFGDGGIIDSIRLSDTATAFLDVTRTPVTLPTVTPVLRVDFGAPPALPSLPPQLPQENFNTLSGNAVTSLSATMQSTSGAVVTAQLSVSSGTLQGRIRNNLTSGHPQANLLDDFIFNSGATPAAAPPMTLTLTGLSAGTYTFIGYFNDSFFVSGDNALADNVVQIFDSLNNLLDTVTVSDLRNGHLTSTDGVARFYFTTNGLGPVSFRFQGVGADARFAFNGFEIHMVPEPSTLLLGTLGAAGVGILVLKRHRRRSRGISPENA